MLKHAQTAAPFRAAGTEASPAHQPLPSQPRLMQREKLRDHHTDTWSKSRPERSKPSVTSSVSSSPPFSTISSSASPCSSIDSTSSAYSSLGCSDERGSCGRSTKSDALEDEKEGDHKICSWSLTNAGNEEVNNIQKMSSEIRTTQKAGVTRIQITSCNQIDVFAGRGESGPPITNIQEPCSDCKLKELHQNQQAPPYYSDQSVRSLASRFERPSDPQTQFRLSNSWKGDEKIKGEKTSTNTTKIGFKINGTCVDCDRLNIGDVNNCQIEENNDRVNVVQCADRGCERRNNEHISKGKMVRFNDFSVFEASNIRFLGNEDSSCIRLRGKTKREDIENDDLTYINIDELSRRTSANRIILRSFRNGNSFSKAMGRSLRRPENKKTVFPDSFIMRSSDIAKTNIKNIRPPNDIKVGKISQTETTSAASTKLHRSPSMTARAKSLLRASFRKSVKKKHDKATTDKTKICSSEHQNGDGVDTVDGHLKNGKKTRKISDDEATRNDKNNNKNNSDGSVDVPQQLELRQETNHSSLTKAREMESASLKTCGVEPSTQHEVAPKTIFSRVSKLRTESGEVCSSGRPLSDIVRAPNRTGLKPRPKSQSPKRMAPTTASVDPDKHQRTGSLVSSAPEEDRKTAVRVWVKCLLQDMEYKTVQVTPATTAGELVALLLSKFRMKHRDPNLFYLALEVALVKSDGPASTSVALSDGARPAALLECQPCSCSWSRLTLRMRRGGVLRVHDGHLAQGSLYKSVLVSDRSDSLQVIRLVLACNSLSDEQPQHYALVQVVTRTGAEMRLLPHDRPLTIVQGWPCKDHAKLHIKPLMDRPRCPPTANTNTKPVPSDATVRLRSRTNLSQMTPEAKQKKRRDQVTRSIPDVITHDSNFDDRKRRQLPSVTKLLLSDSNSDCRQKHEIEMTAILRVDAPVPPKRTTVFGKLGKSEHEYANQAANSSNPSQCISDLTQTSLDDECGDDSLFHTYSNSEFLEKAGLTKTRSSDGRHDGGTDGDSPPSPPQRAPRLPSRRQSVSCGSPDLLEGAAESEESVGCPTESGAKNKRALSYNDYENYFYI